ncbi:MAG: asparagine synthase, partial [Verrucomicrobiales bacterium]|nr:asparagine synthase [Verrucomicrobiales bacterium]
MHQYLERVVDLTDPGLNQIHNMSVEVARERVLSGTPEQVREIDGSFALVARNGKQVRLARSLDRPLRYFLAKRHEGPALIVADRMDSIHEWLKAEGFGDQFHPSYTRMVPAHYVIEIQLLGCPDPDPVYVRFFDPQRNDQPQDLDQIGSAYIGALGEEIQKWLIQIPANEPIGVCFSGGIDSGAVLVMTYHVMRTMGLSPSRLKAFTLSFGDGPDLAQARDFLAKLRLSMFHEAIEADLNSIDVAETIRVVEDYKPLDVQSASMAMTLCRGIRARYPDWRYLIDGDGGDENLKDYPIEENPELTIRSVVHNQMLYQEGWGVGRIKHSLTYSGGLSRS